MQNAVTESRRRSRKKRRPSRRVRRRILRGIAYSAAWLLFFVGVYSIVSGYASAPVDSDGNLADGSLMMPMLTLLGCLGGAAGSVVLAERVWR
jgi:polyferredoxin